MNPLKDFAKRIEAQSEAIRKEIENDLGLEVEAMAMTYIDDNFIAQGFDGHPWAPSEGTILVKTGNLKSGFRSESANGEVRITNVVPYAVMHNNGFKGRVKVREHSRSRYQRSRGKTKRTSEMKVRAHDRNVNMPARQMVPTLDRPSLVFNARKDALIRERLNAILDKL